jgi:phosphatidylglycerol:prolipoprotein diacylglycerol transferase
MNKVAIDLGFVQIYWYSICILIGMALGMFLVFKEAKKQHIHENSITDLVFWTVIFGVIGARLYFVLFNLDYYGSHVIEIFEIWNGGLAIHGGIIAGSLYLMYFAKTRKIRILRLTDVCAPGLIAGQMIGRWGNFFNAEVYGAVVGRKALESMHLPKFIIEGMYIKEKGDYCSPLFLYESIWNLIGLIILLIVRRFKYIKEGQITGFYLVWYSAGRFVIEGMRMDSLRIGGPNGLRVAQLVSIILGGIGLFLIWFRFRKPKFEYLYNAEDNEITRTESK